MYGLLVGMVLVCGQIDTGGLSEMQEAELVLKAAEMKAEANSPASADKLREYAEAGEAIAVALGACAERLGVAVDDFSRTPVGKITTFILAWKLVGKDFLKIFVGVPFVFFATWILSHYFKRLCLFESIEYYESGKRKKVNYIRNVEVSDSVLMTRFIFAILLIAVWSVGMIVILK